jgi:hypothetical protein
LRRGVRERDALRELPQHLPRACVPHYTRVNKFSEVVYETTRYSVPTKFAYRERTVPKADRDAARGDPGAHHDRTTIMRTVTLEWAFSDHSYATSPGSGRGRV